MNGRIQDPILEGVKKFSSDAAMLFLYTREGGEETEVLNSS